MRTLAPRPNPRPSLFLISLVLFLSTACLSFPLTGSEPGAAAPHALAARQSNDSEARLSGGHGSRGAAKRVAVIGAGASGTSAAWFLDRAAGEAATRIGLNKSQVLSEVVVFDQNDYVGGRTTVAYPYGDTSLEPVELGAGVFVAANRHMYKAVERFGLEFAEGESGGLGIWDGEKFVFSALEAATTVDALLAQYGTESWVGMSAAVQAILEQMAQLYDPAWLAGHGAARSIQDFAERAGLGENYTGLKGEQWGRGAAHASDRWIGEFMEAITRANYASDMDEIHGLGAAISQAGTGGASVKGGNWKIFEAMLNESGATQKLNTQVRDIIPQSLLGPPKFRVQTNNRADNGLFDQIFYAAPWYNGPEDHGPSSLRWHLAKPIPHTRYVHLHVTLFTTTRSSPAPSFFGLSDNETIPVEVLTSGYTARTPGTDASFTPPRFQSLTWRGETKPGSGEWVVKIFSLAAVDDATIRAIIGDEEPGWVLRKEWDAYPELRPHPAYAPVEPVKGVQYLAALEPWVSTMETQTLSAREAVARVVKGWWGLGYGDCANGTDAWDWSCE